MLLLPTTPDFALANKLNIDTVAMMAHLRGKLAETMRGGDDIAIRNAIIRHGGTLCEPSGNNWGPFEYEIDVLRITTSGEDLATAAQGWAKCATRVIEGAE